MAETDFGTYSDEPKPLRKSWRWAGYFLAGVAALGFVFGGWIYFNTDTIKQAIIGQLNQRLDAPVSVKSINLSWWEHFPHISLTFRGVVIPGSGRHRADTLAVADKLYFTLNAWHAFRGQYELKTAGLENASVRMVRYPDGSNNWSILKPDTAARPPDNGKEQGFAIRIFKGSQIRYVYQDSGTTGSYFGMRGDKIKASFDYHNQVTAVEAALTGHLFRLAGGGEPILSELPLAISSVLAISEEKGIQIAPSRLDLGKAGFEASGHISLREPGQYDFSIEGQQTTLAHLGVLLPAGPRKLLNSYQSSGQVRFSTHIHKEKKKMKFPAVKANFTCRNAAFRHDSLNLKFTNLNLDGTFNLPEGNGMAGASLNLPHIGGSLNGRSISGNLLLQNLAEPTVSGRLKAAAPLAMFAASLHEAGLQAPQGTILADVHILPSKLGKNQALAATGTLDLQDLGFDAGPRRLAFRGWQGRLDISQGAVSAEGLAGRIGRSDFRLEGHFENLLGYLRGVRPQLGVEAVIEANLVDLDELLGGESTQPGAASAPAKPKPATEEEYRFKIAPHLRLNATCHFGLVQFRRARVREFQGVVRVDDQILSMDGISFRLGGGRVSLDGSMDAHTPGIIANRYRYTVSGIRVDSALYALENFDQGYLRSDNIRGKVEARGTLSFLMSDRLDVDSRTAEAETDISIAQGALINFEPLQAMAKYVEARELENLQFSDLTNHLTIHNQTVTIPEMEIRSNVANLVVSGSHSFDQSMLYHIRVPLKNVRIKSGLFKTAEGSSLEGNVFMLLTGKPGNIKVSLDREATGKKINQDLKEGKKRFLDLFKKKDAGQWEVESGKKKDEAGKEEQQKDKPKDEFMDLD